MSQSHKIKLIISIHFNNRLINNLNYSNTLLAI